MASTAPRGFVSKPGGTGDPGIGTFATINGGGGNDSLLGTSSNDVINGYGGADTLRGAGGLDTMYGGDGNDTFLYLNGEDALDGEKFSTAAPGPTRCCCRAPASTTCSLADFSSIKKSSSTPTASTSTTSFFSARWRWTSQVELPSNLLIDGNPNTGSDNTVRVYLNSPLSDDVDISGWTFQDWNTFGGDADNIAVYGTQVANDIRGSSQNDGGIYGYGGNDTIYGNAGNDLIYGGNENDFLYGGNGKDTIYGGNEVDTIRGGSEDDVLSGGHGADRLFGEGGDDTLYGGITATGCSAEPATTNCGAAPDSTR